MSSLGELPEKKKFVTKAPKNLQLIESELWSDVSGDQEG